jgi:hypothetical protein
LEIKANYSQAKASGFREPRDDGEALILAPFYNSSIHDIPPYFHYRKMFHGATFEFNSIGVLNQMRKMV